MILARSDPNDVQARRTRPEAEGIGSRNNRQDPEHSARKNENDMRLTKSTAPSNASAQASGTINSTLTVTADRNGYLNGYTYTNEDAHGHFEFPAGDDSDTLNVRLSAPAGCYLYATSASPIAPASISPSLVGGRFPAGTTSASMTFNFHSTASNQTYVSFSVLNPATGQILVCDPQVGNDPEPG